MKVMVAVPSPTAVMTPFSSTVATDSSEELQDPFLLVASIGSKTTSTALVWSTAIFSGTEPSSAPARETKGSEKAPHPGHP